MSNAQHSLILVMGVSGSGKTTIGALLAERLEGSFLDADDFHPVENKNKMMRGVPLNDDDRGPWLDAVRVAIQEHTGPVPLVVACSALKAAHRERLGLGENPVVFLSGAYEVIRQRLASRRDHFMPEGLLESQFNDLEEPEGALKVSIGGSANEVSDRIFEALGYI